MPNHCLNELIFRDVDQDAQDRILAAICNDDGKVDFRILVPQPLNIWLGNASAEHDKHFKRTWFDWNRDNWGTKWNAYDQEPIERTDDTLTIRFQTAWGPPYPWLAAVLNSLSLPFEHNWLDEGACQGISGTFKTTGGIGGGPYWSQCDAPPDLHRHLHLLLWGVEEFAE